MKFAKDIMTSDLATVSELTSVRVGEMLAEVIHVRHLPVVNEEYEPVGIISIRDFAKYCSSLEKDQSETIGDIMNTELITASADASISDLAKKMMNKNVSSILIVEDKKLVGIVSERDFLKLYV